MLRGVNKNIIEVMETENQYFEKAILFIRPNHTEKESDDLHSKAQEYIRSVAFKQNTPGTEGKLDLRMWLWLGGATIMGAVGTMLFQWIF